MFFELKVNYKKFNLSERFSFVKFQVVPNENCTGVTKYRPEMQDWAFEEPYKTVYKFWFRSIVNTFFPFFLGLYFNIRKLFPKTDERLELNF